MKIIFLLTWADMVGGTERVILRQASWLSQRHEVEVLSVFKKRDSMAFQVDPKVRVTFLVDATGEVQRPIRGGLDELTCQALEQSPSNLVDPAWEGAFNALADLELERALSATDADIVVSSTPALLAVAASLAPHTVVVHQEHRVAELRGSSGGPFRPFAPRADALVLLSEKTRNWFAGMLDEAAPRLEVIPNPVEAGYRPSSGLESDTIVWAGRMTGEKQPVHAVRAFAEVAGDHPAWQLRFFGDGPEAAAVRREAESLGIGSQVQLVGVSPVMEQEWAKASIAILTSRTEAFPLALLEAVAAGVPVVSYDCPNGPSELVRNGETGFLVTPDSTVEFAAALRKLIEDRELRRRMSAAATAFADTFDIEAIMPRWERLYRELAAARAEPGWRDRRLARIAAFKSAGFGITERDGMTIRQADESKVTEWKAVVEATVPDLLWSGGQLTRVRDDVSAADVAQANLEVVTDALEQGGVDYWLVRQSQLTFRLGVAEADRARVLDALGHHGRNRPLYGEFLNQRLRGLGVRPAIDLPTKAEAGTAKVVRVYEPVTTSSRTLRFGSVYGCNIEFWADSEEGTHLVAPNGTPVGNRLPKAAMTRAHIEVAERRYTTVEPFTRPLTSEIDFPVDVVYTWVDSTDERWRAKRQAAGLGGGGNSAASGDARYRSRDELRHSLRSLDIFAPWVNHIWIVTDDQAPAWLDTAHPKVTVVDHRDVFADPAALPTFNSHSIESQLHHIDGLSEHFLYFNDDFLVGRALTAENFFNPNGLPKFFPSSTMIDPTPISDDDDFNFVAAKNNRELLRERFGRTLTHGMLHAPYALRRSTLTAVEKDFPEAYRRTMFSRVRSAGDISLVSSFAHYYGLLTGRAQASSIKCSYVNVGLREQHVKLDRLLRARAYDVFCLNDFHDAEVPLEEQDAVIDAFLQAYFPVASQFERGSVRNRRLAG
jgi:glycosyltransferase involved in cell wall biosynthesis